MCVQLEAETAHLTHLTEIQKKADALKEATDALQSIIQNKVSDKRFGLKYFTIYDRGS